MKKLLVLLCVIFCGCTVYPTIDIDVAPESEIVLGNIVRDLSREYADIGFREVSYNKRPAWYADDAKNKKFNFYLGHEQRHDKLYIRLIGHGSDRELTKEVGARITAVLDEKYPGIAYETRYFEQDQLWLFKERGKPTTVR